MYFRLPIAWDIAAQRFIHMNGAFLTPDPNMPPDSPEGPGSVARADYDRHVTRWNDNCVFCHNVRPNPGLDARTGRFETSVAELGVACEACHGPGAAHEARNANPLRRYALHVSRAADPTITNPSRLSPARSAEVCGRCHGQRITSNIARVHALGDAFIPGQVLSEQSRPLTRETTLNGEPNTFAARFWSDGTPRLTAYEFQGYLGSPCTNGAKFSCESCHSMHEGPAAGQIRPGKEGDRACTQCHAQYVDAAAQTAHTHHDVRGSGGRCIACHMPPVVYGLVGVRLSHRIEVPNPSANAEQARPDACTSCHIDQTRRWAGEKMGLWPHAPAQHTSTDTLLPEVSERLLAGDPIERAIAADALGREGAHYAPAHRPRIVGLLADAMLEDTYPAVRAIAGRSMQALLRREHVVEAQWLDGFTATDARETRLAVLNRLLAALGPGAHVSIDEQQRTRLRALAAQSVIEIGE